VETEDQIEQQANSPHCRFSCLIPLRMLGLDAALDFSVQLAPQGVPAWVFIAAHGAGVSIERLPIPPRRPQHFAPLVTPPGSSFSPEDPRERAHDPADREPDDCDYMKRHRSTSVPPEPKRSDVSRTVRGDP
jgi:hypothetical protein